MEERNLRKTRTGTVVLNAIHKEVEIVPPQVVLSDHGKIKVFLMGCRFLIHSKMKVFGLEDLADLINEILADLIVYGS